MNNLPPTDQTPGLPPGRTIGMRIPLHKPRWTFVLLGINVAVFIAITVFGAMAGLGLNGTQNPSLLRFLGAQDNQLVAQGDFYRLLTSMFMHFGLIHLFFNCYMLFVAGQDVERLYGGARFLVIYFLSGLGGSLFWYVLGDRSGVSAGASGAIFGLIGTEIAYFTLHRDAFGQRGKQQLRSLLMLAGVNLLMGLIPGINLWAHLGGLVFGLALGWLLAPKYEAPKTLAFAADGTIALEDTNTIGKRLPMLLVVTIVLAALALVGTLRWNG